MPVVLSQHFLQEDRVYLDAEGALYHYPKVYFSRVLPYDRFIYYRPLGRSRPRSDSRHYFGHGVLGTPYGDPVRPDHRFVDVVQYEPFPRPVPIEDGLGAYYESGVPQSPNFQSAVRTISEIAYHRIPEGAGYVPREGVAIDIYESAALQERARTDHQRVLQMISAEVTRRGGAWLYNNIDLYATLGSQRMLVEAKSLTDAREAVNRMRYGMGQLFDYRVRYRAEVDDAQPVSAFGAPPDRETAWIGEILHENGVALVIADQSALRPFEAAFNSGAHGSGGGLTGSRRCHIITSMTVVRKMMYLDAPQGRLLKRLSTAEHVSEAEIMRRALEVYARERLRDPLAELIGSVSGAPPDGAREHDAYLTRARSAT